jgi:ubiquinone/menaquinone biosynthesis C-methylase UbiE
VERSPLSSSTRFFDGWARSYDRRGLQAVAYRPIHDAVLARLDDVSPSTVVDLGCGTGQLTRRLVERFPEATVVAVDLSPGMLAKAAGRLDAISAGHAAIVCADATRLPVAPASIDVVVCTESFHWYRDQARTLDGLAEFVRPGGRLLIASSAMVTRLGDDVVRRVTAMTGRPVRALPPARLRHLLETTGFEVLHQRRIPRLGPAAWPVLTDARRR